MVGLIKAAASADGRSFPQLVDRLINQVVVVAADAQVLGEEIDLDVRGARAMLPVAQVVVVQMLVQEPYDAVASCAPVVPRRSYGGDLL